MKNLLRLSLMFAVVLLVTGVALARAQESSARGRVTLEDIFAPSSGSPASIDTLLAGPADGCCTRHATICESICFCGIQSFICGDNSTGGCSSSCKCTKCI
jgi:hypothetical protein